jgi:hypothetical protein
MGRYLDLLDEAVRDKSLLPRKFPRPAQIGQKQISSIIYADREEVSAFNAYDNTRAREEQKETATEDPSRGNAKNAVTPIPANWGAFEPYAEIRENPPWAEPIPISDGRVMWRWRAEQIPPRAPETARALADKARGFGCVLVADGYDLILVEPWLSELPNEMRPALAANAAMIIALLRGECRERTGG